MATLDEPDRRSRLRGVKLAALVRDHLGHEIGQQRDVFAPGAAMVVDGAAWVLVEDEPQRGLGPALAWALRHGAGRLHVLAEQATGVLARRAAGLTFPIDVWHVDGRHLLPAVPEPVMAPPAPAPAHLALVPTIEAGGATPHVEHGVVSGEVRGLEVCRVVDDPHTGAVRLEVGVGAHDREAFAIVHGDVPTTEALAGVVRAVAEHRGGDSAPHPLDRLAPERLLRWRLEQDPGLVGCTIVRPAEPPVPRRNLKDREPCVALGHRADGTTAVIVCSVGVDLDLIPYAIDARLAVGSEPGVEGEDVVLVVPARDLVPITAELAALAAQPLSVLSPSG